MRRVTSVALLAALVLLGACVSGHGADGDHKHDHEHDGHHCIHDAIKDLPGRGQNAPRIDVNYAHDTSSTNPEVRRAFASKASNYASIRISFFWDSGDCTTSGSTTCGHCTAAGNSVPDFSGNMVTCGSSDVLTDAKKNYILNNLMPAAVSYYAQALSVIPVSGNLALGTSSSTCGSGGTPIPSAHRTTGVANTDLIIYVTAVPVKGGGSTAAWASACRYDSAGRPVAAQVNFVPSKLDNAATLNTVTLDGDIKIAVHEIAHALGFASPWFDSKKGYLALDGVTYTLGGLTTVTSSTLGKSVTYLSSPRVAREVQNYFGCVSIAGGEIEDQGGSGTAGSHWEKRVYNQDTMAGISTTAVLFHSRFTLAMLEDTGHYVANYDMADIRYSWGKGKGCTFLTNKCNTQSSTTVSSSQEFCFDTAAGTAGTYCTYDRLARGYCNTGTYTSSLPSNMQYFSNPAVGADIALQDYCPVILPYSNRICIDSSNQPTSGSSSDIYGETYSSTSRCFDSNLLQNGWSVSMTGNQVRCFGVTCNSGALVLNVKGTTVKCPTDGSAGSADLSGLSGYSGSITCPAASTFGCTSTSSGSLGTTTAAPTVTASPTTGSPTGATPAPATPSPTPAPPTPLTCSVSQPTTDVLAPSTCTGYTNCDAAYCACTGVSGTSASACSGTTTKACTDVVGCLTKYFQCLMALEAARSNSSDPCNAFGVQLHSAVLLAAAQSYTNSTLQQSCQYNLCRVTNSSSRVRQCNFGASSSSVCIDPTATTSAPTTTTSTSTTPSPTSTVTYQVTATITLSGSQWAAIVNDKTQYATLLRALAFDLGQLLGISSTFVVVFSATVGSLVINFGVTSGSGKSTSALATSVNTAATSTTWLSNTATVYSAVSSETLSVSSVTVTSTAAPTTPTPGASSAAWTSTVAVMMLALVATMTTAL